ncbi:MAG: hypothetical protein GY820_06085, partial [Gammaproteobacteria bacterium]|nr:hypothetical protein [Gammaproteobacteria bacterium]
QSHITGEGAVDESVTAAMTRLREILHRDMSSVGQEMCQVKQKVERVVTDMRELSQVVDHDIMKRDQESEQRQQKLLESEKTTDKFKQETPTLNVFAAPKCGLRTEGHDWAPDPMIQALPIQCVKVPRFKVKVEGVELECVIDSGAGPALIVPEGLAIQILSVKHGDLNEVYKAILPPIGDVEIASCTGGNVPIMGQAIVRL